MQSLELEPPRLEAARQARSLSPNHTRLLVPLPLVLTTSTQALPPPPPRREPALRGSRRRRDVGRSHGDLGGPAALGSHRGGRRRRAGGRRGRGCGGGLDDDDELSDRAPRGTVVVPVGDAQDVGEPPRAAVRGRQPRRRRHLPGCRQALLPAAARRGPGGPPARPPRGGGGGGRGTRGGLSAAAQPARQTTPPRRVPLLCRVTVADADAVPPSLVRADALDRPRFSATLTADEIEEDVYSLTGARPRRRPRRRPRAMQKQLDVSPSVPLLRRRPQRRARVGRRVNSATSA